mgnify:CR=1 FL=1
MSHKIGVLLYCSPSAVIFGGPMSANDCGTLAGIKSELEWIPKVVEAGVPYLGLCLGAQLLTRAVGGRVGPHPEGLVEIGYVDVVDRPRGQGVSNYGMWDRLWVGILDLLGVWWLIRRKKRNPEVLED